MEPLKGHDDGNKYEKNNSAENMPLLAPCFSVKLLKNNMHCEKLYINETNLT